MSPLYDYVCENGHTTERRARFDTNWIPCPHCQEKANRVPFSGECLLITETGVGSGYGRTYRSNEAYDKSGRVAVSRFQEACQERDYYHEKAEESAQRKLPSKNLYKEGLKRAERQRNAKPMATT